MEYSDIRDHIKSGDLLAFSHGDWKSWRGFKTNMVRVFTRSQYSHVAIAFLMGRRVWVLEAVKPKLRMYPLSISGDFYWIPCGQEWNDKAEDFAVSCIGTDYSELGAIRAYFEPLESGNVVECAAYVREVFKRMNIDLGDRSTPDAVVLQAQSLNAPVYFVHNGGAEKD